MQKNKGLVKAVPKELLAELEQSYPVERNINRVYLPRLGMVSQDVIEEVKDKKTGKKKINVITEAGTFYTEVQSDELDENGKKTWERTELGTTIEAIIIFERKQLKFYDSDNNTFINSPIFDSPDEVVPLFSKGKEISRGTPAELKKDYPGLSSKGKPLSKLQDVRVLYVLLENVLYQLSLQGTSAYSFADYKKSILHPNTWVTQFESEHMENGSTVWNKMVFGAVRAITAEEAERVVEITREIKAGIDQAQAFYANQRTEEAAADREFARLTAK